jgi:hypothetical protein
MKLLALCFCSLFFFAAAVPARATVVVTNLPMHIVMCREGVDLDGLVSEYKLTPKPKHVWRKLKGFAAPMDTATVQKLKLDGRVRSVETDGQVALCAPPQVVPPGLVRIGADRFPVARINGTPKPLDVDVALLDTGIDPHEDLNVYQWWSPFSDNGNDDVGHGTTLAGVIAAVDNGIGLVGVAPGVRLWNIKALGKPPENGWANLLSGMEFIAENSDQISVVNMSFVNLGVAPYWSTRLSVKELVDAGIVVVAAAANSGMDITGPDGKFGPSDDDGNTDDVLPASLPESMAVSAMDPATDTLWFEGPGVGSNFSQIQRTNNPAFGITNYVNSPGGAIDVAAPGVYIFTTFPLASGTDSYGFVTGTSAAAPHVTGLVALYIAANGRATNAEGVYRIRQAIINAGLPQSQWNTNNTHDPDTNAEPLAIASEAWVPPAAITRVAAALSNFQVCFAAVPGYDYTVQSATNLALPIAWTNLATGSGSNAVASVTVTNTRVGSQGFYRLARKPTIPPVSGPPTIARQPKDQTRFAGTNFFIAAIANGTAPLSYQWLKDGTPLADGGRISGAGTYLLAITGAKFADAGGYSFIVTNAYGSVTSAVATLTIQSPVVVTGVLATATSEIASLGRYASNAVNGIYIDNNFWESTGVNTGYGNDPSPGITFDLRAVRSLDSLVIWNGHESGPSVKRMDVGVSSDGTNFASLGEYTLTTISPASQTIMLGRGLGRYVRFTILENGAGQTFPIVGSPTTTSFVAIDEVEFHEYLGD